MFQHDTGAPGRALVTGCAGFIGSHLVDRLLRDGHEVIGIDCFTDYYDRELKEANLAEARRNPRFTLLELDLAEDPIEGLLDGVERVYHLAAQAGVRLSFGDGFATYVRQNVTATQRLLEEAVRHPVTKFVYASSSSVYGHISGAASEHGTPRAPVSPYGMTKVSTEEICGVYHRNSGVPVVGLRYFTAYGPRQRPDMAFCRFIENALDGKPIPVLGDGKQLRDFTYVDDVVEGTIAAGRHGHPGEVYNVGGGEPVQLAEVIDLLSELLEQPIAIDRRPAARGDARATCADGSKAADHLSFRPAVSLREGLARQVSAAIRRRKSDPLVLPPGTRDLPAVTSDAASPASPAAGGDTRVGLLAA